MDNLGDIEYMKWDTEDQGIGPDYATADDKNLEEIDDDDVFYSRDDSLGNMVAAVSTTPKVKKIDKVKVSPRQSPCSAQWSVSHRCLDCAWKEMRGGRPRHPPPPFPPPGTTATPPLITLQSLGTTRDSGYEPSPTSAFSFSFTSDDEDDITEVDGVVGSVETLVVDDPRAATGVTPPINIPVAGGTTSEGRRSKCRNSNLKVPEYLPPHTHQEIQKEGMSGPNGEVTPPRPTLLRRTKSEPNLWASEILLPRTPIMVGNNFLKTPTLVASHGRNYSLPATTPDGRPMFAPTTPSVPAASRSSREGLIDLAEEDPDGSYGHHRRVLVLALPDLLVDLNSLKREGSSGSSSSSLLSPSGKSCCSSTTSSKDTIPSSNEAEGSAFSPTPAKRCNKSYSRAAGMGPCSTSSTPSNASPVAGNNTAATRTPFRPTWRRPRALSCDVTLEVEFGQELRKVADDFSKTYSSRKRGMWNTLRNSFGRRFSADGGVPPRISLTEDPEEERVSHSLPTSPSHGSYE